MSAFSRAGLWAGEIRRLALLIGFLILDQWTKYLARASFSLPGGDPDYYNVKQVLGEWLQFRLVYNSGAAFGMKPQAFIPWLSPTVFYVVFSAVAILVLGLYYRKLGLRDAWQKYGVALILSGAFGNLIDRLRFHKVTDFIDVGIPGMAARWPTFNIADSCVCVGVGIILIAPAFQRKPQDAPAPQATDPRPSGGSPADTEPAGGPMGPG